MRIVSFILVLIYLQCLVSCANNKQKACLDLNLNVEGGTGYSIKKIGTLRLLTDPTHLTGEKPLDSLPTLDLLFNNLSAEKLNHFHICGLPKRKFYLFLETFIDDKEYTIKKSEIVDLSENNTFTYNYSFVISEMPPKQLKF